MLTRGAAGQGGARARSLGPPIHRGLRGPPATMAFPRVAVTGLRTAVPGWTGRAERPQGVRAAGVPPSSLGTAWWRLAPPSRLSALLERQQAPVGARPGWPWVGAGRASARSGPSRGKGNERLSGAPRPALCARCPPRLPRALWAAAAVVGGLRGRGEGELGIDRVRLGRPSFGPAPCSCTRYSTAGPSSGVRVGGLAHSNET